MTRLQRVENLLLRTKLVLPPVRAKQVGRPRLIEKLKSGLDKALIMVSAPAGYGKTTLVSGWLREIGIPFTWLSVDQDDNEPQRFLQYLVAALRKVVPTIPGDAVANVSSDFRRIPRDPSYYPDQRNLCGCEAGGSGARRPAGDSCSTRTVCVGVPARTHSIGTAPRFHIPQRSPSSTWA